MSEHEITVRITEDGESQTATLRREKKKEYTTWQDILVDAVDLLSGMSYIIPAEVKEFIHNYESPKDDILLD